MPRRNQIEPQATFVIIWEFRTNPRKRRAFERAYGRDGEWARFFETGKGYLGTDLIRDARESNRYLTLDYWKSRASYERFRKQNRKMYEIIDARCEALTTQEVEIGKFFHRRAGAASSKSKD